MKIDNICAQAENALDRAASRAEASARAELAGQAEAEYRAQPTTQGKNTNAQSFYPDNRRKNAWLLDSSDSESSVEDLTDSHVPVCPPAPLMYDTE